MSQAKSSDRKRWSLIASVLMIGLISLVQPGCNCDSSSGTAAPTPTPVASVFPLDQSNTALVSTVVAVSFQNDMNSSTLNNDTFTLTTGGVPVSGTVVVADITTTKSAIFIPDSDLVSATDYIATISSDVVDSAGNHPLTQDYVWSFTVSQTMALVSSNIDGVAANNASDISDIDGSGHFIVFESTATNLVNNITTNGLNHIYRKDTLTGEVLLVSSDDSGLVAANNVSSSPRISDDGRYVAFESTATNLDAIASGGFSQIYLKDMADGSVDMISRNSTPTAGNGNSNNPDISSDGKYIVFDSNATNLGGTGFRHVYLVDSADTDTIELISLNSTGIQGNGDSSDPSISDDGLLVAFVSNATNLVTPDSNISTDVFLRDRSLNETTLVSENSTANGSGNAASLNAEISGNGGFIVFESIATNLVASQSGFNDIYLRDIVASSTSLVNYLDSVPVFANADSADASINFDGRYVSFESKATNLDGGTNGLTNVFIRDTQTSDAVKLISKNIDGTQATNNSNNASISSDGRYVSFESPFSFTLDDTNNGQVDTYRAYNSTF